VYACIVIIFAVVDCDFQAPSIFVTGFLKRARHKTVFAEFFFPLGTTIIKVRV
jgi:hypothetical protein